MEPNKNRKSPDSTEPDRTQGLLSYKEMPGTADCRPTPYPLLSGLAKEALEEEEAAGQCAGRVTRVLELELVLLPRVRLRAMLGRPALSGSMKTSRQVSALSLVSRLILTAGISLLGPVWSHIPPCK